MHKAVCLTFCCSQLKCLAGSVIQLAKITGNHVQRSSATNLLSRTFVYSSIHNIWHPVVSCSTTICRPGINPVTAWTLVRCAVVSRSLNVFSSPAMTRSLTTSVDAPYLRTSRTARRKKTKEGISRDQVYYDVTAITSAEEYNLEALRDFIQQNNQLTVQKLPEDALDALHVIAQRSSVSSESALESSEPGEIFFFREGSVVFWNIPKAQQDAVLELVSTHQMGAYVGDELKDEGVESLEFTYTDNRTSLTSGEIHLHRPEDDVDAMNRQLEMFAFSNAIALSVKLSIWEALLSKYVDSVEMVLQDLKDGKKIRLTEADVLKKAGEILTLSHLVNLSSDLLDTPDFYWDRNNVEKLYVKTCNYLSIARRVKVMNEKLTQCVNLTELLRDHLKDKHHIRLELMIIFLILIEVLYATFHLIERYWLEPTAAVAAQKQRSAESKADD